MTRKIQNLMHLAIKPTLWFFSLFIITFFYFFIFEVGFNEMDVIPYSISTYDSNWLSNDWYLNLKIPYRYLFSYCVGFFVSKFGISSTIVVGRLITYALVSIALYQLIPFNDKKRKSLYYLVAIAMFYYIFPIGNGAGEWLVGGLETKVFAYGFALLSLNYMINRKIEKSIIFAGLSLSTHLLVGIYHLFCLIPIVIYHQSQIKSFFKLLVLRTPLFLVAGSVGLYGIYFQLFSGTTAVDPMGWEYYVQLRVPRHTLPSVFPHELWIKMSIFTLLNLVFIWKSQLMRTKLISAYSLFSVIISLIGLLVFAFCENGNMRYYFFRTSDIILPLFTFINLISFSLEQKKWNHSMYASMLFGALIVTLFIFSGIKVSEWNESYRTNNGQFDSTLGQDLELANWIDNNTTKGETFIIPPENKFFYLNYQRPVFVSWKHLPQKSNDIVEWKSRLDLLAQNNLFQKKSQLTKLYFQLNKEDVLQIKVKHPSINYFLTKNSHKVNLPLASRTKKWSLYFIPN